MREVMLKSIKKNLIFLRRERAASTLRRPINNKKILIIQLAAMGDAAVLANCVDTLIALDYEVSIVCRKGLGSFWKCFFPEINYIEYDMSGGLDEEFCSTNFSSEYEAVFSVSLNPTAAFIASFPTTSIRVGMIETGMYYMGSKSNLDRIANVV